MIDDFAAGAGAHLPHYVLEVILDRILTQKQLSTYLLVRKPLRDESHNLCFSIRKTVKTFRLLKIDPVLFCHLLDQYHNVACELGRPPGANQESSEGTGRSVRSVNDRTADARSIGCPDLHFFAQAAHFTGKFRRIGEKDQGFGIGIKKIPFEIQDQNSWR